MLFSLFSLIGTEGLFNPQFQEKLNSKVKPLLKACSSVDRNSDKAPKNVLDKVTFKSTPSVGNSFKKLQQYFNVHVTSHVSLFFNI
jgi:hypothetical protein